MSKKKKIIKKGKRIKPKPEIFQSFSECVKWNKKSVYFIARGRKAGSKDSNKINWITLGTGFVVAPYRMLTASHVINNEDGNESYKHEEGDLYYLIRHDDEDNFHYYIQELKLNMDIFLYPKFDLAILYLSEKFYQDGKNIYNDKNNYIPVSKEFYTIGTEIGILGYPNCHLQFEGGDVNKPKIGNILLRTDSGVINCRYHTNEKIFAYEFTLAFNPGNSGGPIFHSKSGRIISIVKGFNSIIMTKDKIDDNKENENKKVIEHAHATYSVGVSLYSYLDILKEHKIIK